VSHQHSANMSSFLNYFQGSPVLQHVLHAVLIIHFTNATNFYSPSRTW
jgi:hypothetical protein